MVRQSGSALRLLWMDYLLFPIFDLIARPLTHPMCLPSSCHFQFLLWGRSFLNLVSFDFSYLVFFLPPFFLLGARLIVFVLIPDFLSRPRFLHRFLRRL